MPFEKFFNPDSINHIKSKPVLKDSEPEGREKQSGMKGQFTSWSDKGFGILALDSGGTVFCPADALCDHLKDLGQTLVDGVEMVKPVKAETPTVDLVQAPVVGVEMAKRIAKDDRIIKIPIKVVVVRVEEGERGPFAAEVCCEYHDKK